jgi:STE24 endopeptidase
LRDSWHLWGAAVALAFMILGIVFSPVFISPLFNQYTLLDDPKVLAPILRLARANGIATDKVYEMDASRQTTKISANVSGLLGTMRITLNDNLLHRCSLPEQ